MSISDKLARAVVEKLQYQLTLESSFSDVEISVQDIEFNCHRFILCACSKYFEEVCNLRDGDNKARIVVKNISAETFRLVLASIYGGKDVLNVDNVEDIWLAAKQLQIGFLQDACELYQLDQLTVENCIQLTIQARKLESTKLLEASRDLIVEEFQNVYKFDDFVMLDPKDILYVIGNEYLGVPSEDSVVSAILKWVHHTPDGENSKDRINIRELSINDSSNSSRKERAKEAAELLNACRLCLASGRSLQTLIDYNLIGRNRKAFAVIREALRYQLQPEKHGYFCPPQAVHRSSSLLQNVILSVFKEPSGPYHFSCRTKDGNWYKLKSPQVVKEDIFTASFYTMIFATGNFQHNRQGERTLSMHAFKSETGTWQAVPALPSNADQYAVVSLDHYMYAVAFDNYTTILRLKLLDSGSAKWEKVGNLLKPVSNIVLTLSGSAIIILGYETGSNEITIQSLDTLTMTCSTYENKIRSDGMSVVSFHVAKDTYILLATGELWKLLTCDKQMVKMTYKGKLFEGHLPLNAAVIFNDVLFISAKKDNLQMPKKWATHCIDNVKNVEIIESPSRCLLNTVIPKSLWVNGEISTFTHAQY